MIAPDDFCMREGRFDHLLSAAVEGSAFLAADHALHLRIKTMYAFVA
jgi:hypothetical protein